MAIKLFFKKLHCYLLMFNMAFFFFLLYPGLYYFSRKSSRYWGMVMLRRWWGRLSTGFGGVFFNFEFEEPIDWGKTYMICPYHSSNLDTAMISILVKNNRFCIMGKEELTRNLLTGIFFRTVDLPVDRSSKIASFRAFKAAGERLKNGISMVMFPEGGILDDYPPRLQEFKNGPFRLAIEQQVPVLAVTSLNTWKTLWDDGLKYGSRPGICRVYIHKPVETKGLTVDDADRVRDEVFNLMNSKITEKN
jgi:1-acyl-sn-glycerol-3-phosphate acyltransferase